MKYIYVRGGDKKAPEVAKRAGAFYGTRQDYTAYDNVHMMDVNWKNYDWKKFLSLVEKHNPVMVVAPDYLAKNQLPELLSMIDDLRALNVQEILCVPKFKNAVLDIPEDCIIAVSMPAPTYASFLPDFRLLKGRKVHLLGGRPDSITGRMGQAEAIIKITGAGGNVVSVDGNYSAKPGSLGRWFDGAQWQQTRSKTESTIDIQAESLKNIVNYLLRAKQHAQPMLF